MPDRVEVSIVIPVRNGAETIARAIQSCLNQAGASLQIIVVDNGSHDGTQEVVRSFNNPSITLLELPQPDRSAARNAGIEHSRGDYLVFLDADDELSTDAISAHLNALASSPGSTAAQGSTLFVSGDPMQRTVEPYVGTKFYERLHVRNTIPINSILIARDQASRFPNGVRHCEDWQFWLESLRGAVVVTHHAPAAIVHLHAANTSRDRISMRVGEIPIYLSHLDHRLPLAMHLKRLILLLAACVVYAGEPPDPRIEAALGDHRSWQRIARLVRHHERAARFLRVLIRKWMKL